MKKLVGNKISLVTKLHATGLIIAALAILTLYLSGLPGFPTIPPGVIILGVSGILVFSFANRWKWVLIISEFAAVFITIGGMIDGSSWDRLSNISDFVIFLGTLVSWIGLLIALIFGAIALVQAFGKTDNEKRSS